MKERDVKLSVMESRHLPRMLDLINLEGWEYELVDLERILSVDSEHSVVATVGDEIVGGITISTHPSRAVFGHVVVAKEWRNKKIGKMMMVDAIRRLEDDELEILELYAVPDAIDFYIKLGFRKVGELMIFNGRKTHDIPYKKTRNNIRNLRESDREDVFSLDEEISGFTRRNILETLMGPNLEKSFGLFEKDEMVGFLLGRFADLCGEIGPWIMKYPNRDDAAMMLNKAFGMLDGKNKFIEIPGENLLATELVTATGMEPMYPVQRLVKTKSKVEKLGPGVMCYAALEFG